ncbi:MAG: PQQ-binding-like beta-propeller repeat protein [Caldilineaceae bacterium]
MVTTEQSDRSIKVNSGSRPLQAVFAVALGLLMLLGGSAGPVLAQGNGGDKEWALYGNDPGNMRFQDVDQINPSNVGDLQPAWILYTGVGSAKTSFEAQPIVVDGTMYVATPHNHVIALDPATGAVKWTYAPTDMQPLDQLSICCGQTNRGVAVGDGKVFVGRLDANLVALDAATGQEVWKTAVAPYAKDFTETTAPQYYDGKVIIGISGGEYRIRGFVSAYDAESGDLLWRFYTVPGPGQYGNDTWAGDSWQWGGAPVWTTPAVDPELGLVIFSTGNAAPDLNGSTRAGDNLFAASIVAVDINTGQRKWHFQEVHHDIWDYDGPQPVLLFTLEKDGQEIPAVGHANKNGYYYILDRRTGEPLFDVTETEVPTEPSWQHPSPTQPIPATEELIPHEVTGNPGGTDATPAEFYTPPQEKPLIMQPGAESGSEWPPAAYSPRTGYIYIPAGGYEPWFYQSGPDNTDNLARRCVTNPAIPTPTTTVSLTR